MNDGKIVVEFTREEIEWLKETIDDGMIRASEFSQLGWDVLKDPVYVAIMQRLEVGLQEESKSDCVRS